MARKAFQVPKLPALTAELDIHAVARAAEVIVSAMPDLAIAYGALIDGEWRRYPTKSFLSAIGLSGQEFDELSSDDLANTLDLDRVNRWASEPASERPGPLIFQADNGKNISRWLELHLSSVGGAAEPNFYILRDIDSEIRLEAEKQKHVKRQDSQFSVLSSALNASRDGFAIWKAVRDEQGKVVSFILLFINEAGAAPTGQMPRHLLGGRIEDVVGREQSADLTVLFARAVDSHAMQSEVVQLESPAGWVGAYLNEVVPFDDDQVLASFRDVSEEQRERDRLNWLAEHDHLTGLPNRRNLENVLEKSLKSVRGTSRFIAFAFLDIDDFKKVNDTHGHDVGDALLKAFADRLRQSLGGEGIVARLAGDEFAVVMDGVESAEDLHSDLVSLMEEMRQPFGDVSVPVTVTCSAGVAICAGDERITEVLRIADKAMYRAKHDGKNRFNVVHI